MAGSALALLVFALAAAGTTWCASPTFAILFVLLSLGLNIVVGFAGLLDLGYIAFYCRRGLRVCAPASPHFGIHWPSGPSSRSAPRWPRSSAS